MNSLTPQYVLLNGKTRLSPTVLPLKSGRSCSALYGFSDKVPYDAFRGHSELGLTPFPLVKVYLRTLLDTDVEDLHLVVVDADGPNAKTLKAASMQAVLEAQLGQESSVVAEYSLTLDAESNVYRVEEEVTTV